MPNEYDIEMTTEDTLELDTIIKQSSIASNPIDKIVTNTNYDKNDLEEIQTHTNIFNPSESGEYDIHVNGQVLSINVTDASAIPDSGIARLTFDDIDTDSGTAIDIWGNNDGNINSPTTGQVGANQTYDTGESYSFDASNSDRVELPDLGLGDSSFSFNVWVNPSIVDSNKRALFARSDGTTLLQLYIDGSDGIQLDLRDSNLNAVNVQDTSTINTGTWYMVTATYDGSNDDSYIYIDGTEKANDTTSSIGDFTDSLATWIGVRNKGGSVEQQFDGYLDDPRVYDKALTSTEVSNLYENGSIK